MHDHIKQSIEQKINNVASLPTIPEVAKKIINMVNDPNVDFKKVAEEISKDQSMTTNILKLSNSAFFSKGKEITSIDRAIVTLGLKEVKDIIMVVAAKPLLDKAVLGYDLEKGALWNQGLLVASLAKKIALFKKRKDVSDVVFTGGIIHNIGKIVLALYVQSVFKDIIETVETKQVSFSEAEKEVMGYSHEEIGEIVLTNWNFPPVLQAIVRHYQDPENAPQEYMFEASVVHIASVLTMMAGVGVGSDGLNYEIKESAVKKVALSDEELQDLFAKVPETMKQFKEIM